MSHILKKINVRKENNQPTTEQATQIKDEALDPTEKQKKELKSLMKEEKDEFQPQSCALAPHQMIPRVKIEEQDGSQIDIGVWPIKETIGQGGSIKQSSAVSILSKITKQNKIKSTLQQQAQPNEQPPPSNKQDFALQQHDGDKNAISNDFEGVSDFPPAQCADTDKEHQIGKADKVSVGHETSNYTQVGNKRMKQVRADSENRAPAIENISNEYTLGLQNQMKAPHQVQAMNPSERFEEEENEENLDDLIQIIEKSQPANESENDQSKFSLQPKAMVSQVGVPNNQSGRGFLEVGQAAQSEAQSNNNRSQCAERGEHSSHQVPASTYQQTNNVNISKACRASGNQGSSSNPTNAAQQPSNFVPPSVSPNQQSGATYAGGNRGQVLGNGPSNPLQRKQPSPENSPSTAAPSNGWQQISCQPIQNAPHQTNSLDVEPDNWAQASYAHSVRPNSRMTQLKCANPPRSHPNDVELTLISNKSDIKQYIENKMYKKIATPIKQAFKFSKKRIQILTINQSITWKFMFQMENFNLPQFKQFKDSVETYQKLPRPFDTDNIHKINQLNLSTQSQSAQSESCKIGKLFALIIDYTMLHDVACLKLKDFSGEIQASISKEYIKVDDNNKKQQPEANAPAQGQQKSEDDLESLIELQKYHMGDGIRLQINSLICLQNVTVLCARQEEGVNLNVNEKNIVYMIYPKS